MISAHTHLVQHLSSKSVEKSQDSVTIPKHCIYSGRKEGLGFYIAVNSLGHIATR